MEDSGPCVVAIALSNREELTPLDMTRLVRLFYCVTAVRFAYSEKDAFVALTYKRNDNGFLISMTPPLIRTELENIKLIKEAYVNHRDVEKYFPGSSMSLAELHRPKKSDEWSDPVIYDKIINTNQPAPNVTGTLWLTRTDTKRNRKKNAYYNEVGYLDPYLLWDPDQYDSYPVKITRDPTNRTKNPVAEQLEIEVDVLSREIPAVDVLSIKKEEYSFENVPELVLGLLGCLKKSKTKTVRVWVDVTRVVASVYHVDLLGNVEEALSQVFTKSERNQLHLSPSEIQSKYDETKKKIFKQRIHVGFETLMEHLESVDPEAYKNWKNAWLNSALDAIYKQQKQALPGMGILLSRYVRGYTIHDVSSGRYGAWMSYDESLKRWVKQSIEADKILELGGVINAKFSGIASDKTSNKDLNAKFKACSDLVQSETNREKILKEVRAILRVAQFSSIADKNYDILPVANLCIEILHISDNTCVVVRPHMRQDYTTKTIASSYKESYTWEHPEVETVMSFFRKFTHDEESLEFLLHWCGSLLWRGNRDRCILQIPGGGGNGKTTFVAILEVLENLATKLKASAFYAGEKRAGTADTEFYNLKGASVAIVEEIEPGKTGRVVVAKNLSGGGRLPLRRLFEEEEMVDSTAKLLFVGNHLLHWPDDPGMRDRLYNLQGEARFSKYAPVDPEQQKKERHYPSDPNFISNIPKFYDAILWIFVQYLKKYVALGRLPECEKIKRDTERYWVEQNIYTEFFTMRYREDKKCRIALVDLFTVASQHFSRHPCSREYNRERLVDYVHSWLGTYSDGDSVGYDEKNGMIYGLCRRGE